MKRHHFYLRHKEFLVYYEGFKVEDISEGSVIECRATRKVKEVKGFAASLNFVKRTRIMAANMLHNKNRKKTFREKLWITLEDPRSSKLAGTITLFLLFLILLSTTTFCLETLPYFYSPSTTCDSVWCYLESICIGCFTVEICLRLFSCPSRRMYFKDVMNVIGKS